MKEFMHTKNRIAVSMLFLLVGASLLPFITGCEETLSGSEFDLPYRRELIVQGFLTANSEADTIRITRTLPTLDRWSIEEAAITDAVAVITGDGVDYPLVHVGRGKYVSRELRPVVGTNYTIKVTWKDLTVTGTAAIPPPPELVRLFLDTIEGGCDYPYNEEVEYSADAIRVMLEYVPHGSNMNSAELGISYSYNGVPSFRTEGYNSFLYEIDSSGTTNKAAIYESCQYENDSFAPKIDTLFLNFVEYEADFRKFYETRWNGSGGEDLFFGPSGENPQWNVGGDGFGWFFGRTAINDTTILP